MVRFWWELSSWLGDSHLLIVCLFGLPLVREHGERERSLLSPPLLIKLPSLSD